VLVLTGLSALQSVFIGQYSCITDYC